MNLADPAYLKSFLARHGLSARKGLGQRLLTSAKVVGAIVEATGDIKQDPGNRCPARGFWPDP